MTDTTPVTNAAKTVLDIDAANQHVTERAKLPRVAIPAEMRALIEQYETLSPRLYQIANYFKTATTDGLPFVFDSAKVSFKAPIKYPWNVLAAAANYKAHAEGIASTGAGAAPQPSAPTTPAAPPPAGFDASAGRFRERLDSRGAPIDVPHRAMVQARQIYVYANAHVLGWHAGGAELAERAMTSLRRDFEQTSAGETSFAFSICGVCVKVANSRKSAITGRGRSSAWRRFSGSVGPATRPPYRSAAR